MITDRWFLSELSRDVKVLEKRLKRAMESSEFDAARPKWHRPEHIKAIEDELRQLRKANEGLLTDDLYQLLEWPNKEMSDPKLFYGGKRGFEQFNRTEDWFTTMGFTKYQTIYTFTDRWDKAYINATFLVPSDLQFGEYVPIMWYFHGGGFCTGASDHIPWYSESSLRHAKKHRAIIIAPDYPLGPEANYKDINESIRDFMNWYKKDGYFPIEANDPYIHWTQWLRAKIGDESIDFDTNRLFIEGDSAGGHAAVQAVWLNASSGPYLKIRSVLLRYPMLLDYRRDFPKDGKIIYMGQEFKEDEVTQLAESIRAVIYELEAFELVPTRSRGSAPQFMSAAFALSITGDYWRDMFQRQHGKDPDRLKVDLDDPAYVTDLDGLDCLERVESCTKTVLHDLFPRIVIYQGHDDTNCPIKNTNRFIQALHELYFDAYCEEDPETCDEIVMITVNHLNWKPHVVEKDGKRWIELKATDKVGHAFDYDLHEENEPFLVEAYDRVDERWCA